MDNKNLVSGLIIGLFIFGYWFWFPKADRDINQQIITGNQVLEKLIEEEKAQIEKEKAQLIETKSHATKVSPQSDKVIKKKYKRPRIKPAIKDISASSTFMLIKGLENPNIKAIEKAALLGNSIGEILDANEFPDEDVKELIDIIQSYSMNDEHKKSHAIELFDNIPSDRDDLKQEVADYLLTNVELTEDDLEYLDRPSAFYGSND